MMKTKLLLLLIQVFCGLLIKGQEKKYVDSTRHIIYDFKKQKYDKDINRIKVHTPIVFKIKNINPFAYKVTISSKDSIVASSDYETNFSALLTVKELQKAEEKLSADQAAANSSLQNNAAQIDKNDVKGTGDERKKNEETISSLNKISVLESENQILQKNKEEIKTKLRDDSRTIMEKDQEKDILKSGGIVVDTKTDSTTYFANKSIIKIDEQIRENTKKIETESKKIEENTKEYQLLLDNFNSKYISFILDSRSNFKLLRLSKEVETIALIPSLNHTEYKKYEKGIEMASANLLNGIKNLDEYKKSYSEFNAAYFKLVSMNNLDKIMERSGVDKLLSYPKFLKEKSDQLNSWFATYNFENVIKQSFLVSSELQNVENFSIKSNPIQPENDMVEFKVKIEPWDKKSSAKDAKPKEFIYRQAVYGGTRVDLSLGLAAAYYKNTEDYLISKDSVITVENVKLLSPSLVGMVTMSYRRTDYISFGGSFGMGVDVADGKIQLTNFFIGPTMLFGKKQRIFISVGPSVKNVGKLKNEYIGQKITPTGDLSSYIKNYYKVGMFASITYTLTKDARALIKNLR